MNEPQMALTLALYEDGDEEAKAAAWKETHDWLLEQVPHRTGPVEAYLFDIAEQEGGLEAFLNDLGGMYAMPEHQQGFLDAAAQMRHPMAMVTSVMYLPGPAGTA